MKTIKISGFSTGAYGNLGDEVILLSADGDVALHAGDTVVIEAAAQQKSAQNGEEDCPCGGKHVPEPVCKNCGLRYTPAVNADAGMNVIKGELFFKFWKEDLAIQVGDNHIIILPITYEAIEVLAEAILYTRQEVWKR